MESFVCKGIEKMVVDGEDLGVKLTMILQLQN